MKKGYIATFDFLDDWVSEQKMPVMYTEREDIESMIKYTSEIKEEFEKGTISNNDFVLKYCENIEDKGYLMLTNMPIKVLISVHSSIKYGYKYLIEKLIEILSRNIDSSILEIKVYIK